MFFFVAIVVLVILIGDVVVGEIDGVPVGVCLLFYFLYHVLVLDLVLNLIFYHNYGCRCC